MRWKFHTLLGLLHKQSSLDFGIPPRLWTELPHPENLNSFWNGRKLGQNVIWSYDIWLPVNTQNGHTSNVRQADNGQEVPLSTQWAWPLLAVKPWMQCICYETVSQGASKAWPAGKDVDPWCLRISGHRSAHRSSDWSLANTEGPVFLSVVGRWTRQKNRPWFRVFPGSIIRKTGQYNTQIKHRNFLFAIILNLCWHKFALTSAPNGSSMKFIFLKMWPLAASRLKKCSQQWGK